MDDNYYLHLEEDIIHYCGSLHNDDEWAKEELHQQNLCRVHLRSSRPQLCANVIDLILSYIGCVTVHTLLPHCVICDPSENTDPYDIQPKACTKCNSKVCTKQPRHVKACGRRCSCCDKYFCRNCFPQERRCLVRRQFSAGHKPQRCTSLIVHHRVTWCKICDTCQKWKANNRRQKRKRSRLRKHRKK